MCLSDDEWHLCYSFNAQKCDSRAREREEIVDECESFFIIIIDRVFLDKEIST
jgi:hypothetical protein